MRTHQRSFLPKKPPSSSSHPSSSSPPPSSSCLPSSSSPPPPPPPPSPSSSSPPPSPGTASPSPRQCCGPLSLLLRRPPLPLPSSTPSPTWPSPSPLRCALFVTPTSPIGHSPPSFLLYSLLFSLSLSLSSLSRPDLLLSLLHLRPSSIPFFSPTHFNRLLLSLSSHPFSLRSFNILISTFARSRNLSLAYSLFNSIFKTPSPHPRRRHVLPPHLGPLLPLPLLRLTPPSSPSPSSSSSSSSGVLLFLSPEMLPPPLTLSPPSSSSSGTHHLLNRHHLPSPDSSRHRQAVTATLKPEPGTPLLNPNQTHRVLDEIPQQNKKAPFYAQSISTDARSHQWPSVLSSFSSMLSDDARPRQIPHPQEFDDLE